MSDTGIALAIMGVFVAGLLLLACSFSAPAIGWPMAAALWVNVVMGLAGLVALIWVDRLVGSVFVAGSVVGLSVIAGALRVRPAGTPLVSGRTGGVRTAADPAREPVESP